MGESIKKMMHLVTRCLYSCNNMSYKMFDGLDQSMYVTVIVLSSIPYNVNRRLAIALLASTIN